MSSSIAISVSDLSKCYHIYDKPRDRLMQMLARGRKQYFREFWALKDVSFEVKKGETIGLVGRNGSGKSTLLQLICGTLNPTSGNAIAHGRIAALLELGSGFNPEFTGRENVYMNGSILGLSQELVRERYDDIAEFADIGEFIEQPVKTYSSGMLLRLAFAVQVQLDPDILIVDEALAVGDAGFQLKCMLRMKELQENGTTILFVSHDMGSIARLCDRAILVDHGSIVADNSDSLAVIKQYDQLTRNIPPSSTKTESATTSSTNIELKSYQSELGGIKETSMGTKEAQYLNIEFLNEKGKQQEIFSSGDEIEIRASIKSYAKFSKAVSGFSLKNKTGVDIWGDNTIYANTNFSLEPGLNFLSYRFKLYLPAGEYFLYVGLADISKSRVELDQRWPVRKLTVTSTRSSIGYVHSPANISFWRG